MMSHGPKGAQMANLHVALDVISEDWKSKYGVSDRDYMEAS